MSLLDDIHDRPPQPGSLADVVRRIDWKLLAQQLDWLSEKGGEYAEGLLCLLADIQWRAVQELGLEHDTVYHDPDDEPYVAGHFRAELYVLWKNGKWTAEVFEFEADAQTGRRELARLARREARKKLRGFATFEALGPVRDIAGRT